MSAGDDWTAGAFDALVGYPDKMGEAKTFPVAGWLKGPWALDFRVWEVTTDDWGDIEPEGGWCLTHVPTGFVACGIKGALAFAQSIADAFDMMGGLVRDDRPCAGQILFRSGPRPQGRARRPAGFQCAQARSFHPRIAGDSVMTPDRWTTIDAYEPVAFDFPEDFQTVIEAHDTSQRGAAIMICASVAGLILIGGIVAGVVL